MRRFLLILALPLAWPALADECTAQAAGPVPTVIELYTSEGCSSCPPADHWLSGFKGRADVVAQAFHVDYWDSLGWKDRFANPAYSQRQRDIRVRTGAGFVYTPQVVVNGHDRKDWDVTANKAAASPVLLSLRRQGARFEADVQSKASQPLRLAGYWTLTEDGQSSQIKAGENAGVSLRHDFVVRAYEPVGEWEAVPGSTLTRSFALPGLDLPAGPARTLNFVVVDARTGVPLQAVRLGVVPAKC